MKYREIDKEAARQCCKEHTVFNDKKHKERVCDHCPLRRDFKDVEGNIRRGICWFILVEGLGPTLMHKSLYAHAEKAILDEEDVSHPKEWMRWLIDKTMIQTGDEPKTYKFKGNKYSVKMRIFHISTDGIDLENVDYKGMFYHVDSMDYLEEVKDD